MDDGNTDGDTLHTDQLENLLPKAKSLTRSDTETSVKVVNGGEDGSISMERYPIA